MSAEQRLADLGPGVGRRPVAEERDLGHLVPGHAPGTDGWWREIGRRGTPLWLPDGLPGGPGGRAGGVPTLLLLHRSAAGAYADLNGLTDRSDLRAGTMTRVAGTDVLAAAFGVPPGYVGSYAFVPADGPLRSPAPRNTPEARRWWVEVLGSARPDPLGGGTYLDSRGTTRSVAEVPSAPAPLPAGPRGAAGAGLEPRVWRRPDGVAQPVWLHVPEGVAPPGDGAGDGADGATRETGLLVLLDGEMWAHRLPVAPLLDDLHRRGLVPPTATVLVDATTPDRRAADLAGGDGYLDLLADDLLPRVVAPALAGRGLRLTADPRRTVVAGQSFGGLAAFRAAARRPGRFGVAVSQSGSFWWPDRDAPDRRAVPALLRAAPPPGVRTVLQYGRFEGVLTDANRQVATLLRERGADVHVTEVPGGHDWAWWSRHLRAALLTALT